MCLLLLCDVLITCVFYAYCLCVLCLLLVASPLEEEVISVNITKHGVTFLRMQINFPNELSFSAEPEKSLIRVSKLGVEVGF